MPIICLSNNIKNIYGFCENGLKSWGIDNLNQESRITVTVYKDINNQYSDILNNWSNSETQRQKMIEYPEDEIEVDYIYNK